MGIWTVIGGITGVIALLLSAVALMKQYKIERRMKEKERLREFAEDIGDVISRSNRIYNRLENPEEDIDIRTQLTSLSKDVLAYNYENGENPTLAFGGINFHDIKGADTTVDEVTVESPEEAFDVLRKKYGWISSMRVESPVEDNLVYSLEVPLGSIMYFYKDLDKVKEHENLVGEFCSSEMRKLERTVNRITQKIIEKNFDVREETIDPGDFESFEKIGFWLYNKAIDYEAIQEDLKELVSVSEDLEGIRKDILATSYS